MGGHDAIADREAGHAGARLDHVAHDLVAEHGGPARLRRDDLGDVGAAQAAAAHAQEQLAGAHGRSRPVAGRDASAAVEDRGLHAGAPLRRSRAPAQQRSAMATLRRAGTVIRSPKTAKRRRSISSSSA